MFGTYLKPIRCHAKNAIMKTNAPPIHSFLLLLICLFCFLSGTEAQRFRKHKKAFLINNRTCNGTDLAMDNSGMERLDDLLRSSNYEVTHLFDQPFNIVHEKFQDFGQGMKPDDVVLIYFRGFAGFSEATEGKLVLLAEDADPVLSEDKWIYPEEMVRRFLPEKTPVVLMMDVVRLPINEEKMGNQSFYYDRQFATSSKETVFTHLYFNDSPSSTYYLDRLIEFMNRGGIYIDQFSDWVKEGAEPGTLLGVERGNLEDIPIGILPEEMTTTTGDPDIPTFWPVPPASARHRLSRNFFMGLTDMAGVDSTVTAALGRCGYTETSYFRVPEGFAMVTKMERIKDDASSEEPPRRWDTEVEISKGFSLTKILRSIFSAEKGKFRIIAFVATPVAFSEQGNRPTESEAIGWLLVGASKLPDVIAQRPFTAGCEVHAMIYEFEKKDEEHEGSFVENSNHRGLTHLEKSLIMGQLER